MFQFSAEINQSGSQRHFLGTSLPPVRKVGIEAKESLHEKKNAKVELCSLD